MSRFHHAEVVRSRTGRRRKPRGHGEQGLRRPPLLRRAQDFLRIRGCSGSMHGLQSSTRDGSCLGVLEHVFELGRLIGCCWQGVS